MPNNFVYTNNIPLASNDPSNDQPNMKTNTNSTASLLAIDHIGFNANGSGIHKQVTLKNEAAPGLADGDGVLFANLASGQSWPFWQNAAAGSPFQLLGKGNYSTNGYEYFPGGLLIQWGQELILTDNVSFPISFSTQVLSIQLTFICNATLTEDATIAVRSANTAGFSKRSGGAPEITGYFWMAIGK